MILTKCQNRKNRVDNIDESCQKMYYCDMGAERFLNYNGGIFYDVAVQKNDGSPVGSGRGKAVNEMVELTKSVNEALKKDKYRVSLNYNAELDDVASNYHINDVGNTNADWKNKKLDREMFRVDIPEVEKADSASKIAKEIEPTLTNMKDYEWSIGYYVEPKENNKKEVVSREITDYFGVERSY